MEGRKPKIEGWCPGWLGQNVRSYHQNNQSKKELEARLQWWSNSLASVPEFKSQYCPPKS
jgi:hypothetical protein